jgi:ABC-2 type transport system ATP-binding protein
MSNPVVRFEKVSKSFARTRVLRDVGFAVQPGQAFGLAGVNGAGKTTLIKCMLDFCALDAGRIELFGLAHTLPRSRARLAFLPERFLPPYYLRGRDFLRFMLAMQGRTYVADEVVAMLAALDLEADALARPVRAYSKGMTQKLGLAACFLSGRDLFVLDEPMSGLDPKARACVKALLAGVLQRGATLFFTSHTLTDVAEVCDQMVILHQGVPYFAGAPRALCDHYGEDSMERAFLRCIETPPNG